MTKDSWTWKVKEIKSQVEKKRVKKIKKEANGDEEVEDEKNIMKEGEKIYNYERGGIRHVSSIFGKLSKFTPILSGC